MAELKAGKNVMEKMRIGDTVIRSNGEAFSSDKYLCMDGKYAFLCEDGGLDFHAKNPVTGEKVFLPLNEDEVAALKEWLQSQTIGSRTL